MKKEKISLFLFSESIYSQKHEPVFQGRFRRKRSGNSSICIGSSCWYQEEHIFLSSLSSFFFFLFSSLFLLSSFFFFLSFFFLSFFLSLFLSFFVSFFLSFFLSSFCLSSLFSNRGKDFFVPDLMAVLRRGVTQEDYIQLHAIATRLEESGSGGGGDLRLQIVHRDRLIKFLVIALLMAIFLPNLLSLLITLCVIGLIVAYFLDVEPFHSQTNQLLASVSQLFSSGTHTIAAVVKQHQDGKRKLVK